VSGHGVGVEGRELPHRRPAVANPKLGTLMKKKSGNHENGNGAPQNLIARATAAQNIADVARQHFKTLKAEYKQARKAYRQARKAAKRARKEAEAAAEILATKAASARPPKLVKKAAKRAHPVQRKTHTATAIPLPTAATASVSSTTA
jgi:hypothetical protein